MLLVDKRIERDGGLASLAVADDQLALAAADRDQGVERLETRLDRLVNRFPRDDAGRLDLDAAALGRLDRALAVDRIAKRVDDAAEQALADRHVDDGAGALGGRAFGDAGVRAEDDDADIIGLEVQGHALHAIGELDHLAGLDIVEAVDAGDAVADAQCGADFRDLGVRIEVRDLVANDAGDFSGADIHVQPFIADASLLSLVRMDASIISLPSLITIPPRIFGSTWVSSVTSRPARLFSWALSAAT